MTPVVQPVGLHVNAARTKQLQSSIPPAPTDMMSPNNGIRPPPSYPAFGVMANNRPSYQPGANQMSEHNHSGYGTTPKSETETTQICSGIDFYSFVSFFSELYSKVVMLQKIGQIFSLFSHNRLQIKLGDKIFNLKMTFFFLSKRFR